MHSASKGWKKAQESILQIRPLSYYLVFFNTFEELTLSIRGLVEDAGVIKLYEPSPTPCLYVAPVENIEGRAPLIPLFLAGNSTPTILHKFSKRKDSGFPFGCADAAAALADGRRGRNVYEVNPWLWQFGRGKPSLGGLTVEDTGRGRMLHAMKGSSVDWKLVGVARRIKPDSK
jgi:hypothetical protein